MACRHTEDRLEAELAALRKAELELSNAVGTVYETPVDEYELGQEVAIAAGHVEEAASRLSEAARAWYAEVEDRLPEDYDDAA